MNLSSRVKSNFARLRSNRVDLDHRPTGIASIFLPLMKFTRLFSSTVPPVSYAGATGGAARRKFALDAHPVLRKSYIKLHDSGTRTMDINATHVTHAPHEGIHVFQQGYEMHSDFGLRSKSSAFIFCKRAIDISFSLIGLFMLAHILLVVAAAIKVTSKGPVFFRPDRYGLDGKLFKIYKFRTMYTDLSDESGVCQTTKNDCRITPIGKLLRRTSIDELPQLFNVLEGTMSLVGPRPHVPNMIAAGQRYEDFHPRYMDRHSMMPGITGLAQVKGYRGETTSSEAAMGRLHYDLEYARNASIIGDIKILFMTIRTEFLSGSGF